jgi:hypothetical protein
VQVAGLLLNAKIEIDAVAFLPLDPLRTFLTNAKITS